jgi:hypothetical protein
VNANIEQLLSLSPKADAERMLQSRAVQETESIAQSRLIAEGRTKPHGQGPRPEGAAALSRVREEGTGGAFGEVARVVGRRYFISGANSRDRRYPCNPLSLSRPRGTPRLGVGLCRGC